MGYVDHVVIAVPDLDAAARCWRDTAGISFQRGGRHPGGTENALAVFAGQDLYLELITVCDPASADPFTQLAGARQGPLTWAAGTDDVDRGIARLAGAGVPAGPARAGRRRCPDGSEVTWRSAIAGPPGTTAWPFLIEWPARGAARLGVAPTVAGLRVTGLTVAVPDPAAAAGVLAGALGFTRAGPDSLVVADGAVTVTLASSGEDRPGPVALTLSGQRRGSFALDGLAVSIEPERVAI
ncbi:MAG TPA: VOC family protein [Streptosporangiaceae bacterium]